MVLYHFNQFIIISNWFFGFQIYSLGTLYSIFLPILRNTYPLISGIFGAEILMTSLRRIHDSSSNINNFERRLFTLFVLLILIPFIFNHDIFGFGNGSSFTFGFFIFLIGTTFNYFSFYNKISIKFSFIISLILIFSSIILNGLMPYISYAYSGQLWTASRFAGSSTATSVFIAYFVWLTILKLATKYHIYLPTKFSFHILLSSLALGTGWILINIFVTFNGKVNENLLTIDKIYITSTESLLLPLLLSIVYVLFYFFIQSSFKLN